MSNAIKFITESLGSCGFAVLLGRVAYTCRQDLWAHGMDASSDFADKTLPAKLNTFVGCQIFLARFEGIESGLIKVLARSPDQLAQRIEWITGYRASLLIHESEMEGTIDQTEIRVRKKGPDGGDRYRGVITVEGTRTCSSCDYLLMGGACRAVADSGIHWPAPNEPRRCLGYKPEYAVGGRTGVQLWPELITAKA